MLILDRYSIIRQAIENIDCWIVLAIGKDNTLYSLYNYDENFVLGKEKVSNEKIEIERCKIHSSWYFDDGYETCVNNCFLTYAHKEDALNAVKFCPSKVVVAHCLIPVNSNYIMGDIDSISANPAGYVSDRLYIDKLC